MTSRAIRLALLATLFAFVVGCRWAVLDRFGSQLPEWDQWDAEGLHALVPWLRHDFTLAELFRPQNEHRVVLTKILNLGLTLANGQWDQRLECAVNAFLPGLIAAALFAFCLRWLPWGWHAPMFVLIAAAFGLPVAWHNIVAGFHSQQFFLIGLSLGAVLWLPWAPFGSRSWWLGAVCAVLALGSMATGFFAAGVAAGIVLLRAARRETTLSQQVGTLSLCGAVVAVGCLTRISVNYHDSLRAHTAADFALTAIRGLEWPADFVHAWIAFLLWLPWIALALCVLRRKGIRASEPAYGLFGLGGWVVLQILAIAYARGAGGPFPASRYVDNLALGAVVNAIALGWLLNERPKTAERAALGALGLAWVAVFGIGVFFQVRRAVTGDLPAVKAHDVRCEATVRAYLATGDENILWSGEVPYPGPDSFLERISIPELRALLPSSVQPVEPGPLSYLAAHAVRRGIAIAEISAVAAALLGIASGMLSRRREVRIT